MRKTLAVTLASCVFGLALPCHAQSGKAAPSAQTPESYTYTFMDDDLIGDTLSTNTAIIKVRPHPPRIMLIRARASFVAEMIKSVELM